MHGSWVIKVCSIKHFVVFWSQASLLWPWECSG